MGEVNKAHGRRVREGWFGKYAPTDKPGIDIGCGKDPLNDVYRKWDIELGDGDATFMEGVEDNSYFTVHASHVLEHVNDPVTAVRNWYRILAPGGHLIVLVPHRDLYEKKKTLPSNWNHDHKTFWLPDKTERPDTLNFKAILFEAIPAANLVSFRVLDDGWIPLPENSHSCGEYSIEAVIRKPLEPG